MTSTVRVSPRWLWLREAADAAARATELVEPLRRHLPARTRSVVHDLGCGTGSMARWLAPRLPGVQHWVMYDTDADLLEHAATHPPDSTADGTDVTVETRCRDITRLSPADLADADLITASALLDMLTADELERLASTCAAAGCPTLVTVTVVGRVELTPPDPLDGHVAGAFDAHQRRVVDGRELLGPDAVAAAVDAFTRSGADVLVRPSPWRLGAAEAELTAEWFTGWVGAAREQSPGLDADLAPYARRRLAEASAGRLGVTVHHEDLLAVPR